MSFWRPEFLEFSEENGLVIVDKPETYAAPHEGLFLHQIKELNPKAVFFRRYFRPDAEESENAKPYRSEPAVIVFDKRAVQPGSEKHDAVHKALWSTGQVEVYVLKGEDDEFVIYNCRKPKKPSGSNQIELPFENDKTVWESLKLADQAISEHEKRRFRPQVFGNGTFWEIQESNNRPEEMDAPQFVLLDYLLEVRKRFKASNDFPENFPSLVDNLLLVSLLVKFLENISDPDETNTLQKIYAKLKVNRFEEALAQGKIFAVLDELALKFNGKIFACFEESERDFIGQNTGKLSHLIEFLNGGKVNPKTGQYSIWEQFEFRYLPTELISSLYENFIQQEAKSKDGKAEKGIVYTPIFLVDFLVDEAMPIDRPEMLVDGTFKVLDPSCGSGVFLVAAYKRILEWWMLNNKNLDGSFPILKPEIAQDLMERNIFGIDVKPKAVQISIFSLTTTFLKVLSPKQVWNELRFRDLSENVLCFKNKQTHKPEPEGFFLWAANAKDSGKRFNIVLGNPPFNPETGKKVSEVCKVELLKKIGVKHSVPQGKLAPPFFEASMQLAEKVCMILPSGVMLYSKDSQSYRNQIFTNYSVSQIWDFTHLRRVLFRSKNGVSDGADTPVIAILAESKPSDQRTPIVHTVIRRTQSSEGKTRFEIDSYDRHSVPWNWSVSEDKYFIWKTNLMSGGGLFQLIYRLSLSPTLGSIISSRGKSENWQFKIGYIVGNVSQKNKAPFITDHYYISDIVDDMPLYTKETSETFEATRNQEFFTPPYILIKDSLEAFPTKLFFLESHTQKTVPFKRNFFGIKSDNQDLLLDIFKSLKENPNRIFEAFILGTSASACVKQETYINKEDIEGLPFQPDISLTSSEKLLIDDLLNFNIHLGKSIDEKTTGGLMYGTISQNVFQIFLLSLISFLNEIYAEEENEWQPGKYLIREDCVICQLGFGPKGKMPTGQFETEPDNLKAMLEDEYRNRGAIYKRVIRLYDHQNGFDCIYLIKPNAMRYWLKSIALRDAGQIFLELRENGF